MVSQVVALSVKSLKLKVVAARRIDIIDEAQAAGLLYSRGGGKVCCLLGAGLGCVVCELCVVV